MKQNTQRLPPQKIKEILSSRVSGISDHDRDEMAIPSYLHWNPLIRWLMWRRYKYISFLGKFSRNMHVLEFGCGTGLFLPELSAQCQRVYALDIFPDYAKMLCKELNLPVIFKNSITEVENFSLDVIIAADVLEHLSNDELKETLDEFSKKLKQHGRLIISGPTENLFYRIGRIAAGFGDKGGYHETDIISLIKEINNHFILLRTKTLPFCFPPYLFKVCEFEKL